MKGLLMIKQYRLTLFSEKDGIGLFESGYQFYGMLLQLVNPDYAEMIHQDGISPINQYVIRGKDAHTITWTINLLGDQACEQIAPIIEKADDFMLHKNNSKLTIKEMNVTVIPNDNTLLAKAHEFIDCQKPCLNFLTPTSFKKDGVYQIFPSVENIILNLVHRWNSYSEAFLFDDMDAINSLIDGIKIAGYDLHSSYYKMKGIQIPAFQGELRFTKRLSIPIAELFNLLLLFSEYSGVGIKTSLGMGAVRCSFR
jgi:CRISPR-associated endoribonuclease Cas6